MMRFVLSSYSETLYVFLSIIRYIITYYGKQSKLVENYVQNISIFSEIMNKFFAVISKRFSYYIVGGCSKNFLRCHISHGPRQACCRLSFNIVMIKVLKKNLVLIQMNYSALLAAKVDLYPGFFFIRYP